MTELVPCTACGSAFCAVQRAQRGIWRCLYTNADMREQTKARRRKAS